MPVVAVNPWSSARTSANPTGLADRLSVTAVPASGGCASGRAISDSDLRSALNGLGSAGHDSVPKKRAHASDRSERFAWASPRFARSDTGRSNTPRYPKGLATVATGPVGSGYWIPLSWIAQ